MVTHILLWASLLGSISTVDTCTIIAIGKDATADGAILLTHTDDAGGEASDLRLIRVPAADHKPHSKRPVYSFDSGYPRVVTHSRGPLYKPVNGQNLSVPMGYIPQVPHTFAYYDINYGLTNEMGLSIAESTVGSKSVGWPKKFSYGKCLFNIAELSKVALERCATAKCAIQTMGDLAVRYGFYSEFNGVPSDPYFDDSAEVLAIADRTGQLWIFHVMTGPDNSGAVWAAQRIPDDMALAAPNTFVIREIHFNDTENFMYSPHVKSFAQDMGWWDPSQGPFDFTQAYSNPDPVPIVPLYGGRRMWRIYDNFAPSLHLDPTLGYWAQPGRPTYPFAVRPDKKVTLEQVRQLLRDHYEGTPFDMTKGLAAGPFGNPVRYDGDNNIGSGSWERPISVMRAVYSFIMQLRPNMPSDMATVMWFGLDAPHGTVYVPFYNGQNTVPPSYLEGKQSEFSQNSAFWAFNIINNWSQLMWSYIRRDVVAEQKRLEEAGLEFQKEMDRVTLHMTPNARLEYIEKHQTEFAESVVSQWWALAWRLVAKYNNGYITTSEKRGGMLIVGYPIWWLKAVKYDHWPGNTFAYSAPEAVPVTPVTRHADVAKGHAPLNTFYMAFIVLGGLGTFTLMRLFDRRHRYSTIP